jgi:transposase
LRKEVPVLITDERNELPRLSRQTLWAMWESYQQHKKQIVELEKELTIWPKDNEDSCRLEEVLGIGVHTSAALLGKLGNGRTFRNGREVAAFVGLVQKQASSGGKEKLLGISKRGDGYLRRRLVQGAKSVIRHVRRRLLAGLPGSNPWAESLLERKHPNIMAIALANRMARIAWVILAREEHYRLTTMN